MIYEEDVEEEEDEEGKTTIDCDSCCETIVFDEDVALLQVAVPTIDTGELLLLPFLDDKNEPIHTPIFLDFSCWESLEEELKLILEDLPPISDPNEVLECDYCRGSILANELIVGIDLGEVVRSKSGSALFREAIDNRTGIMCIPCAVRLNTTIGELWRGLSIGEECEGCTIGVCWRKGHGNCHCPCHRE